VVDVDANKRIVPKIGPMQGLHPNAKSTPIKNELCGCPSLRNFGRRIFLSTLKSGNRTHPNIVSPNIIIITPAARAKMSRHGPRSTPMYPAKRPKRINTTEKPKTYAIALGTTFPRLSPPEIKAKNAGTSGSVQGAKNISKPARNAAGIKKSASSGIIS